MLLWQEVLRELGTWCCTSTTLDLKKAERRFEHEGLSFFTITLPAFGKDLQKGLEEGKVDRSLFQGFAWKGGLPLFLGGFLDRVFDRGTGRLLDAPCVDSIFALRQLTLMLAKIALPCSSERVERAIQGYIECEKELKDNDQRTAHQDQEVFADMAYLLFKDVFQPVNNLVDMFGFIPRHGPGATADKLTGNGKFDQRKWPERLERVFPFGKYAIPNERYSYLLDQAQLLEPGAEIPVRVITVPKTLKTPRIIAIEPTAMQYMQQGLMQEFVPRLEDDPLISGMIGFTDQEPNQLLAKSGSEKGKLATLDLSEASDRVSNQHVRLMLRRFPELLEAVDATRSRKADVPGKDGVTTIRLAKFASMGSALCFPMEAMVFLTVIFLGVQDALNRRLTRGDIKSLRGQVRVYGDDIIIPVRYVPFVLDRLRTFGYKVNVDKSYWNGKFRESCGKDFYDGHDVTPVRVRREFPVGRTDVPQIISLVSLRNQLYFRGLWRTVKWLDGILDPMLKGHYPVVSPTSAVLGRHSFLGYETEGMCHYLQSPLVKGWVVSSKAPVSTVSGEGALLKWFLKRGEEPFADRDHLERQGRPDAVNIKLRKVSPF
jgi:hypothetical protein